MVAAANMPTDHSGLLEDFDVLRDGIERHVEWSGEVRHLQLALGREAPDDGAARAIGERAVHAVQRRNFNHSVEYYQRGPVWDAALVFSPPAAAAMAGRGRCSIS